MPSSTLRQNFRIAFFLGLSDDDLLASCGVANNKSGLVHGKKDAHISDDKQESIIFESANKDMIFAQKSKAVFPIRPKQKGDSGRIESPFYFLEPINRGRNRPVPFMYSRYSFPNPSIKSTNQSKQKNRKA
ncbi:MAG: hypothetical protein ACREOO_30430 [bacterium]